MLDVVASDQCVMCDLVYRPGCRQTGRALHGPIHVCYVAAATVVVVYCRRLHLSACLFAKYYWRLVFGSPYSPMSVSCLPVWLLACLLSELWLSVGV
jgi:hypothetical protein